MTSASHAEGHEFDPRPEYLFESGRWHAGSTQGEVRDAKSSEEAGVRSRCLVVADDRHPTD
jgi:hypothetical protein